MSDEAGQARSLTVMTPIHPGREIELMALIDGFPIRERSPFHGVAHTHFARLVVMPDLIYEGPPQKRDHLSCAYLLFTSTFDGSPFGDVDYAQALDGYLEVLRVGLGTHADQIWGDCVGYPGSGDAEGFRRYLAHNRIPTAFFAAFYEDATVEDVRTSMQLRQDITEFAIAGQDLSAAQKLAAFKKRFLGEHKTPAARKPRDKAKVGAPK